MHFLRVIKGSHTPLRLRDKGLHRDRESSHAMNPYIYIGVTVWSSTAPLHTHIDILNLISLMNVT